MTPAELKSIRQDLGLTQKELAELLGLSRVFIGMMERGEKPICERTAFSVLYISGAKLCIGDYTISRDSGSFWIRHTSGKGVQFSAGDLESLFKNF